MPQDLAFGFEPLAPQQPEEDVQARLKREILERHRAQHAPPPPPVPVPTLPAPTQSEAPDPEFTPPTPDTSIRQDFDAPVTPGVTERTPAEEHQDWKAAIRARHRDEYGTPDFARDSWSDLPSGTPSTRPTAPLGGIPEEEPDPWAERVGRGILSRAGDLGAGLIRTHADSARGLAYLMGDNLGADAARGLSTALDGIAAAADSIQSESYKPIYTDVGKALSDASQGSFGYMLGFIAEQAPITIADALATIATAPVYLTATTGDFANERAQNDGRTERTVEDYAYGFGAAVVSLVLDKVLLGKGSEVIDWIKPAQVQKIADETSSGVLKRLLLGTGRGAATESVEEGAQEFLTSVGTEKGASVENVALAAAGGALAGGPAVGAIDVALGRPGERGGIPEDVTPADAEVTDATPDGVGSDTKAAIQALGIPESATQGEMDLRPPQGTARPETPGPDESGQLSLPFDQGVPQARPQQAPQQAPQGPQAIPGPEATPESPDAVLASEPATEDSEAALPEGLTEDDVGIPTQGRVFQGDELTPVAPAAWAGYGHRDPNWEENYPPEVIAQMEAERQEREAKWAEGNKTMRHLVGETRRSRQMQNSAAMQMLQGIETPRAIRDGTESRELERSIRDRMIELYTNLSDYARVAGDRVRTTLESSSQSAKLQTRLEDAALALSRARGEIMNLATHFDQRRAEARAEPTPLERAVIRLTADPKPLGKSKQVSYEMAIDPLVLQGLGVDPAALRTAALGQDVGALEAILDDINQKAKGLVQSWEADSGNVAESARIRDEGGRGVRPGLPESDRRDVRDYDPVSGMTRQQLVKARELEREMTTMPAGEHSTRSGVEPFTAKDLGTDQRRFITDSKGKRVPNPEYGKVLPELSEEERAERAREIKEEEETTERSKGFLDPVRGAPFGKGEPNSLQANLKLSDINNLTKTPGHRLKEIFEGAEPTAEERADIDQAIDRFKTTERQIPPAKKTRMTPKLRKQIMDAREEARKEGEERVQRAERAEVLATQGRLKHRPKALNIEEEKKLDLDAERRRDAQKAEREREAALKAEEEELQKEEAQAEEEAEAEDAAIQKAYEEAGGNAEVAPEVEERQAKRKLSAWVNLVTGSESREKVQKARNQIKHFTSDVKAGRREGSIEELRARAQVVWDTRRTYRPPKGLMVHDPTDPDNPFKYVRSVMPKVDPSKPGRQRFRAMQANYKGDTVIFYDATQVESSRGWRLGWDVVDGPGGMLKRVRSGVKAFHQNDNFFSPQKLDNLIDEVIGQMNLPPSEALTVAKVILDQQSKRGQKSRSGTRGHEEGDRAPRRKFDKTPVDEGPIKVKIDEGTGQIEGDPIDSDDEGPTQPTPEQLDQIAEILEGLKKAPGEEGAKRAIISRIAELKGDIARLEVEIPQAESVMPRAEQEIGLLSPEDGETVYTAPDGWPASVGWTGQWRTEEEGDETVVFPFDPLPGTDEKTHRRALVDAMKETISHQRDQLERKKRLLEEERESLDAIESTGSEGRGGPREGTGEGPEGIEGTGEGAGDPEPDRPDSAVPGGENVDGGVSTGGRAPVRETIDLFAHVSRQPVSEAPLLDKFGPVSHQGTVVGEITPEQRATVRAILHKFKERMALVARGGDWADSVNKSGFLVMNGTGSGKSIIVAMAADTMYDRQPEGKKRPVLIAHQPGLDDAIHEAFESVGLNWKDKTRYVFTSYQDLRRFGKENYAAVLFDEAHLIKSSQGKDYATAAKNVKAPFRVFLTATPTDAPLQENYYLQYMMQDEETPMPATVVTAHFNRRLGLAGRAPTMRPAEILRALGKHGVEHYVEGLNGIITELAENNAVTSYTLPTISEGSVLNVNPEHINQEVLEVASRFRPGSTESERMNEHLKVEDMVERTLDQLADRRGDREWGVVTVFHFVNPPTGGAEKFGRFQAPAIDRFNQLVRARAAERGVAVRPFVLKGGVTNMSEVAREFREGGYNLLIMGDSKGNTGISLDDQSPLGNKPKLMLVAGVSPLGQGWIQLMGRLDRKGTTSIPFIKWVSLPESVEDRRQRDLIKSKLGIQRAVTGAAQADQDAESEFSLEKQLEKNPHFRRRLSAIPDYLSPVDTVVSEKLAAGPQGAQALVDEIARNETDPALAELARSLRNHPALRGVTVVSADPGALGAAREGLILVAPGQGAEAVTVLHEAVHHVTHRAVDTNPVARARLAQLMRAVSPEAAPGIEGVLSDPHEFVAEAFSNPAFQQVLQNTRLPGGNLWQRFKTFVRSLLGHPEAQLTAWDAMMALQLTDPGTVTQDGHGDVSSRLMTVMHRRRSPIGRLTQPAREALADASDPAFQVMLGTMTFDQIVKSYGKIATDTSNGGKTNHLKALYDLMDARYSFVTRERNDYSKRVLEPLRKWAVDKKMGLGKVSVQMEPGAAPVRMTRLQYLSELANISGYAQVHFGKDARDPANSMLGAARKPGSPPPARTRTHEFWDLHKPQFDKLGPDGKELYNELATYFAEQIDLTGVMRAQQWLDVVAPKADGRSWFITPPGVTPKEHAAEVRREVKRLAEQSDEELEAQNIVRDSLEKLDAILQPGRVPGAYFPLKRFGEFIVTANEREHFVDDEHRDELLKKYLGAKVDETNQEIIYKAVSRFETQSDARAFRDAMRARFPNAGVSDVMVSSDQNIVEKAGLSNTLIKQFENRIEGQDIPQAAKDAQIKMFVQSMIDLMPEASYADTFRPRKGVLGASVDLQRSLHTYGSALSHYKGGALFSTQQRRASRDFSRFISGLENLPRRKPELDAEYGAQARRLRRIEGELAKREALVSTAFTENAWAQKANNVGFAYFLVSASYNILNSLQPILMTTPYLAGRFGSVAATNAMNRAYRKAGGTAFRELLTTGFTVTKLKGLVTGEDFDRSAYDILTEMEEKLRKAGDKRHADLLRRLADRNMIEATIAMDMAQGAKRSHIDPSTGEAKRQGTLSYLSEWMRTAPHITEVMNRSVTAIASFDLEYARLIKKGASEAEAVSAATEYAADVINETQFNYQNWNKPRYMQGSALARTALMFKQHPQHVYYFMISRAVRSSKALTKRVRGQKLSADEREEAALAAKQLAYFVGMHVLATGALGGTPEPIKWMIQLLNYLFGDEEEPFNFELEVQNAMADWLGPELSSVGARGLPALLGLDLSSRIGIDSLLMFEGPDPSSPDAFLADLLRIAGGPMISLFERGIITAPNHFDQGNYVKALEAVTPKALRDPLRAWRTHAEGFTTYDGRVFSESDQLGPAELFLTSMGLNPASTSEMYLSRTVDSQVDAMTTKATGLKKRAYHARGNKAAFTAAIVQIRRWNRDNPAFAISEKDLLKSFKVRDTNQAKTQAGILAPDRYRQWADERNRFRNIPVTQE